MKWFKILLSLVFVGAVSGIFVYVYVYNKPHKDYEKAKPAYTLSAEELYLSFVLNQSDAESQYNGRVIQFDGHLNLIETHGELTIAVFAFDDGFFGPEGIRCSMLEHHAGPAAELTDRHVNMKGLLTGFSGNDIIFEHCSIVRP